MADVVLVTMPWDVLASPSLALGTLHQLLLDEGIAANPRTGWSGSLGKPPCRIGVIVAAYK